MWLLFGLGLLIGIAIYWAITIIMVNRVRGRRVDSALYVPILWSKEPPENKGRRSSAALPAAPSRPE